MDRRITVPDAGDTYALLPADGTQVFVHSLYRRLIEDYGDITMFRWIAARAHGTRPDGISQRRFSAQLRELEREGLIRYDMGYYDSTLSPNARIISARTPMRMRHGHMYQTIGREDGAALVYTPSSRVSTGSRIPIDVVAASPLETVVRES